MENSNEIILTDKNEDKINIILESLEQAKKENKKIFVVFSLKSDLKKVKKYFLENHKNIKVMSIFHFKKEEYDVLFLTPEKIISYIFDNKSIIEKLDSCIFFDIYLLDAEKRGPELEIILSLFKYKYEKITLKIISSDIIKNINEISKWLDCQIIHKGKKQEEIDKFVLKENELYKF